MDFSFPDQNQPLGEERCRFLDLFKTSCKRNILEMLRTSQSGHPGGSLSCLDILATLYAFRLSRTNEKIVISNGHISPGVYSVLAEMGVVDAEEVRKTFRQKGSIFEGHVTRHVLGIFYGTGPLGIGVSVGASMALAEKLQSSGNMVFATLGDGEAQEGQVHEMALFAAKQKLDNYCVFVDYNRVQLTDSLQAICPIDVKAFFQSHKWNVLEIDGHDPEDIWKAVANAEKSDKPTAVIATTIMGHGVKGLEEEGQALKATWHGKAPKPEQIDEMLQTLELNEASLKLLEDFRKDRQFTPPKPMFVKSLAPVEIDEGEPIFYGVDELTDCRSAYGQALLDLAKRNPNILAMTADLGGSVMTKFVESERPNQHLEFGICEQNMVSSAGGLSLSGFVPFCSTFGAFMTSRAKDQARVNDINQTNVKMVSTHCGLSVGEDGPTHQAIDDMGSMLGLLNTMVLEPADPNQCDRIIRYVASHYGNFYVRMGRHKVPVLTREDGGVFFDETYTYQYGKTDVLRTGTAVTIVATGACVSEALKAREESGVDAEIVIASSIKQFDQTLADSLRKTKKVITVEDHNFRSGLGAAVALFATQEGIGLASFQNLAVKQYQLSGKAMELYEAAGIDRAAILKTLKAI